MGGRIAQSALSPVTRNWNWRCWRALGSRCKPATRDGASCVVGWTFLSLGAFSSSFVCVLFSKITVMPLFPSTGPFGVV